MTIGLAFAFGISQLMKVVLFQVQPRDPVIFGGVARRADRGRAAGVPDSGASGRRWWIRWWRCGVTRSL